MIFTYMLVSHHLTHSLPAADWATLVASQKQFLAKQCVAKCSAISGDHKLSVNQLVLRKADIEEKLPPMGGCRIPAYVREHASQMIDDAQEGDVLLYVTMEAC